MSAATWRAGATTVLIHPIGNDAGSWDLVGLPDAVRVEFPGHGARPRAPGWTQAGFADEVVSSIEGPLDVIGMSMGGTIVANLLVRYPDRIRSAMIVCGGSITAAAYPPARNERRLAAYAERASMSRNGMQDVVDDTLTRWFTPFARRVNLLGVRYARDTLLRMDPDAWADVWRCQEISDPVSVEALRKVASPVTIVGGMHDFAAGLSDLADAHALIPRSRFEVMPISHMAHLEHPEFVRAAIDRHFAWAPIGQRVEDPIASGVWISVLDEWPPRQKEGAIK